MDDSEGGIFGGERGDFGGSFGRSRPTHEAPAYLKEFVKNQTRAAEEEVVNRSKTAAQAAKNQTRGAAEEAVNKAKDVKPPQRWKPSDGGFPPDLKKISKA